MTGKKTDLNRRNFLKFVGVGAAGTGLAGCDLPTTVTLEEGKEDVVSYLAPEEYVIPGIGVWYASTCTQCAAGCGIHGRVREGRALKIEGNPDSPLNHGKTCMMGQGAVQHQYNPNRLRKPMLRKNGSLTEVSWDEANEALKQQLGGDAQLDPNSVAWLTGAVSGHQAVLINNLLEATGSDRHYVHEVVGAPVWQQVCRDMLGDDNPVIDMANAKSVLSFGADFLGTWQSPVHFSGEYAKFRRGDRGVLMVAEPKMSLTGANADLWLAAKPGSEGMVALAIANQIIADGASPDMPANLITKIKAVTPGRASQASGISEKRISQMADMLKKRSPSVVLAGAPVEGQPNGYQATAAVMILNMVLGNIGKTILPRSEFPLPGLVAKSGGTKALSDFAEAAKKGEIKVALIYGANPVYTAPAALNIKEAMDKIGFKVQLSVSRDETTPTADLVLPMYSNLEDWGSFVSPYRGNDSFISMQQPLMEPLHPETKGFGDTVLAMLQMRGAPESDKFKDFYGYLRNAVANLPPNMRTGVMSEEDYWVSVLQKGVIPVSQPYTSANRDFANVTLDGLEPQSDAKGLTLIPSPRLGLWDGRHANIPWLQEAPDQINKVVWDSWAEIHPKTAKDLKIKHGDLVEIKTAHSSIRVKAFLFRGIHPNAIAVPLGQGHDENFGQFAKGIGANPLQLIDPAKTEGQTGEWAMFGQTVDVSRAGRGDLLVRMGGVDTQHNRKLAAVISADQYRRTEGGKA